VVDCREVAEARRACACCDRGREKLKTACRGEEAGEECSEGNGGPSASRWTEGVRPSGGPASFFGLCEIRIVRAREASWSNGLCDRFILCVPPPGSGSPLFLVDCLTTTTTTTTTKEA